MAALQLHQDTYRTLVREHVTDGTAKRKDCVNKKGITYRFMLPNASSMPKLGVNASDRVNARC